jgi:hypothetical protein
VPEEPVCEVVPGIVELAPSQIAPPDACEPRAEAGGVGGVILGRAAAVRTPAVAGFADERFTASFAGSDGFAAVSAFSASTGVFVGSLLLTKRC